MDSTAFNPAIAPKHLRRTSRSNSLFYSPANSEDEVIPKKYRRIRNRHHPPMQRTSQPNANTEQSFLTSPSKFHTISTSNLNNCDDENTEPNSSNNDSSVQRNFRKVTTTFGAERSNYRSPELTTTSERNESIWSYSSNTNRLLEDVEKLKELIFLRDIQLGFLPDECEVEFESCFKRLSQDDRFAVRRAITMYYQN